MARDRARGVRRRRGGFSTSRIRRPPVEVGPRRCRARSPREDELVAIAEAMRRAGRGVFQAIADRHDRRAGRPERAATMPDARHARRRCRAAAAAADVQHVPVRRLDADLWREMLDDAATNADGAELVPADQPRPVTSCTGSTTLPPVHAAGRRTRALAKTCRCRAAACRDARAGDQATQILAETTIRRRAGLDGERPRLFALARPADVPARRPGRTTSPAPATIGRGAGGGRRARPLEHLYDC